MVNWLETAPNFYVASTPDSRFVVGLTAFGTYSWLLSRGGRAVTGGNVATLDEAKEAVIRAAEG
jgi:hypothetical protein